MFRRIVSDLIVWMLRWVLRLRYRITVTGLDRIPKGLTGTLILPNHPGYIDPPIVLTTLWRRLRPRPMVFEPMFKNLFLFWTRPLLRPVLIPVLEQHSVEARKQAHAAIEEAIAGLKRGENHLMYPAGRLYREGGESIGSTRGLAEVLREVPDAPIVMVRTRGLWGSMYGFARTASLPKLTACLAKSLLLFPANLFFFMPRRKVTIELEMLDRSALPEPPQRETVNPFFDEWYNRPGPEKPVHVPYHFLFGRREFVFPPLNTHAEINPKVITDQAKAAAREAVEARLDRKLTDAEQSPDVALDSLGLDSLDRMEVAMEIERRSQFRGSHVPTNMLEAWALAQGLLDSSMPEPPPAKWFRRRKDTGRAVVEGETIPEAFVYRALAQRGDVAVADSMSGAVTYERMLIGARLMANRFRKYDAPNVGLMLPASVGADVAFFAIHLAGKTPVILNFTTGPKNLAHACEVAGLTHVVTSRRFVDRAGIHLDGPELVMLEDVRKSIKPLEKILQLLALKLPGGRGMASVPRPDPDAPAVILFTSGSEKAPKAVPLTHRNIIANVRSSIADFDIRRSDASMSFLPPFHSFGLTVMTMMPVLGGGRCVHHPDPTDARALAQKIRSWQPTIVATTPTFLSYILDRSGDGDLESLRLAVVGAEKCPPKLFDRYNKATGKDVIYEGYGVTECSPVVSANRPGMSKRGSIGKPLTDVEVAVIDAESGERVPQGERGMLVVHGPNVFPGYLGDDAPDPFVELDGKRWYRTGDLVTVDENGFITFAGRLKRFVKAAGEMISLPALEQPLVDEYPSTEEGPQVAVEGVEHEDGSVRIVAFSTVNLVLEEANRMLNEAGFHGLMRLHEIRRIESIPVLGTGKTDYKQLRQWIHQPEAMPAI